MIPTAEEDYEDFDEESDYDEELQLSNSKNGRKRTAGSKDSETSNKKPKSDLYKQPTTEELNQLRETENLFNSNIFRLQIDELLREVATKPKYLTLFETWLTKFQEYLKTLPDFDELIDLTSIKRLKRNVFHKELDGFVKYFCLQDKFSRVKTKIFKPSFLKVFGEYEHFSNENVKLTKCVLLGMNKKMFLEKDYLNDTYFYKKHVFLIYLQYYLQKFEEVKEITLEPLRGNEKLIYLKITPSCSPKMVVNLFVVPEVGTFKHNRFLPDRNNLKELELENFPQFKLEKFKDQGTYLYNSLLSHDNTMQENQEFIKNTLSSLENVQDAVKLLIISLHQRELNKSFFGFSNELVLYLITYLVVKKKVNKLMSSYQVVRIFWSFVSTLEDKISICDDKKSSNLDLFVSEGLVLLDCTGTYNVAAFLDQNIWKKTKWEARKAIEALDSNRFNSFVDLFTTKMPFGLQYDLVLKVTDLNKFKKVRNLCTEERIFKYFGFYELLIGNLIVEKLKYALSRRVLHIIPIWDKASDNYLVFGISLNAEHCMNVIEVGPKQYESGSEEFKTFWGKLAALRRFKDSSIYEAVYFEDAQTIQSKRLLSVKIVDFVMKEKLELTYRIIGSEMENLLKISNIENPFPTGSSEDATIKIKSTQIELDKILRNLKLPLPITAFQCTSDVYSYTDVFPPIPATYNWRKFNCTQKGDYVLIKNTTDVKNIPHLTRPIDCVIQLALNSKWPKTLDALRAMKTLYFFEISKLLRLEHDVKSLVTKEHLTIFFKGYAFRLHLFHPKELVLLRRDTTDDGVVFYRDTEESLSLEMSLEVLPKISGALNGVHTQYPSFGPTTCLIKRWLRSQMLDEDHLSDTVINLLSASLFLAHEPFEAPVLPQVGFMRFLQFMSKFDHNFQAIIVNFNNSIENLGEFETKFLQSRQSFNNLYIITPFDEGKSVFTKCSPSVDVLNRIKLISAQTYERLITSLQDEFEFTYKQLFVANTNGFDLLIHILPSVNQRRYQQANREQKKLLKITPFDEDENKSIPVIDFDPVEFYLKELRKDYGHYALFFHDYYGGSTIGVLFKQTFASSKEFKISNVNGCLLNENNQLELNKKALMEDFAKYGTGIVKSIERPIKS